MRKSYWGVSHPPTFKPKAVNGKRLVAANHYAKNFYNVVVSDTPKLLFGSAHSVHIILDI